MLTNEQIDKFTEIVLAKGARPAMRVAIGDTRPHSYDKADTIAGGIARGVREAIKEMGATIPGTPPVEGQVRAMFGKEGGEIILVLWPEEGRIILTLGDDGEFRPNDTESANTLADYLTALPVMA